MKKILSKLIALLVIAIIICPVLTSATVERSTIDSMINNTVSTLIKQKATPGYGDEWSIISIARSKENVPEGYFDTYYKSVQEKVKEEVKKEEPFTPDYENDDYTSINDLERVIIALTAIGKDPTNVAGVNLLNLIWNKEDLGVNGVNELGYALIALDSNNYSELQGGKNTRESIINKILSLRTKDGGFSWDSTADTCDLDTTAMVIQALYKYKDRQDVREAIDTALTILRNNQTENGDYIGSYMGHTYESPCTAAQVVVMLDNLGLDAVDTTNGFVKNKNLIDVIHDYYDESKGGFKNSLSDTDINAYSTDQLLYALVSYRRYLNGEVTIFDMSDVKVENVEADEEDSIGTAPSEEVPSEEVPSTAPSEEVKDQEVKDEDVLSNEDDSKVSYVDNTAKEVKTGDEMENYLMLVALSVVSLMVFSKKANLKSKVLGR